MLIILSISSKNLNSLTKFLKFIYLFKTNKNFKLQIVTTQSQRKNKKYFFSVLRSPHVNKKSQEQFEYYFYNKQIKIYVFKIVKFLKFWKLIKTKLFFDIKIKIKFILNTKSFKRTSLIKINSDKFTKNLPQNKNILNLKKTDQIFFKLLDVQGETLLKLFN